MCHSHCDISRTTACLVIFKSTLYWSNLPSIYSNFMDRNSILTANSFVHLQSWPVWNGSLSKHSYESGLQSFWAAYAKKSQTYVKLCCLIRQVLSAEELFYLSTCTRAGNVLILNLSTSALRTATSLAWALAKSTSFLLCTISWYLFSRLLSKFLSAVNRNGTLGYKIKHSINHLDMSRYIYTGH